MVALALLLAVFSALPSHGQTLAKPVRAAPLAGTGSILQRNSLPAVKVLEGEGFGMSYLIGQTPERREVLLSAGVKIAEMEARAEADAVLLEAAAFDPARADAPLLVSRLQMLQTSLSSYLEPPQLAAVQQAYSAAYGRLSEAQRAQLEDAIRRTAEELGVTVYEEMARQTPELPSALKAPKVVALLKPAAAVPDLKNRGPEVPSPRKESLVLKGKVLTLRLGYVFKKPAARLYRVGLELFRTVMTHAGEIYRKYLSGREMDAHSFRWSVIENLFKHGDFKGSFGHPVHEGAVEPMSGLVLNEKRLEALRKQERTLGGARLSPMVSISGMSFPQLSAQSHLSLMYMHLKLAKELGVRHFYNSGEGGPRFHLAILEGDREQLKREIIQWNVENAQFSAGSWDEAKVVHFVDELMAKRNELFAEFSPEDFAQAQVVAQFGSALNGIRGSDYKVDYAKLRKIAESPYVAMVQYKLKQAAKRGAKVDPKKVDNVVAALRELPKFKPFKAPEVNPDMESHEKIASLIIASRIVAKKPISLKFAVGDTKDAYDFFEYLKNVDALPEHIQLDGRGKDFSPGSGNAPPGANTSLPANEAIIVMDAILKKLGIRERIFIEATGDTLLPDEGLERLALGADGISSARLWMGMGLGCAMVKACANGGCPYGIAARSNSLVGLGMDPMLVAPKGYLAAANWFKSYSQDLSEAGSSDWRTFRKDFGLGSNSAGVRVNVGGKMVTLDFHYNLDYVENLLRGTMTRAEIEKLVFQRLEK